MHPRTPVIVGIGLSDYPRAPQLSVRGHILQATHRALADAGLDIGSVDGLMCTGTQGMLLDDVTTVAEFLGINATYLDGSMTGGSAAECVMANATQAIQAGSCECLVIAYGSDLASNKALKLAPGVVRSDRHAGPAMWESLWGIPIVGAYGMIAQRHMHEYGTTVEHLNEIAIASRLHAARNPHATLKSPLSPADLAKSPVIADPLRVVDCCLVNDGGGAVVLTTWERAQDLDVIPIFPLGAATAQTHWNLSQMRDFTTTGAAIAGPRALQMAGRRLEEIDVLQIYDSFTITPLLMLEGLGFCDRGQSGPFVMDGRLRPGGSLPMNTDGGGLANSHPGMRGIFLLIEAVVQLRQQAGSRQVERARTALICGAGGLMSTIGVVVLGSDPQ